ncbi:hypothetical protein HR09_10030 [Porphyromonas gulae]|nr:hypothetical protein HR09_10030 [Porphyromonas gulae]KGN92318.1 hypothetical protein HQ46_00365 [Porphyromonas gulae]KGO02249.1 hypothetical protein HQ42_07525 [Porphyromonas gulae]
MRSRTSACCLRLLLHHPTLFSTVGKSLFVEKGQIELFERKTDKLRFVFSEKLAPKKSHFGSRNFFFWRGKQKILAPRFFAPCVIIFWNVRSSKRGEANQEGNSTESEQKSRI